MKQRWLLSILSALALIYYAMPRLPFTEGLPGYFSILWVTFAVIAIGGNLAAFLYAESKQKEMKKEFKEEKQRYYGT